MSRIPKWKVEKAKVKVVFRLQFHATHIPQPGWDKLFVSLVPADTGKATAKTTKSSVRNGNCKWSDPIYETTRLLQDSRSRKYDDKLYKLVVAMGSSRSNLLGEAAINLADFADALRPSSIALPLYGCDYGTVLHVTVQLLTSKTGFREFEQQRELSVKSLQTSPGQRSHGSLEAAAASIEMENKQLDKVNIARVRFEEYSLEFPSHEEVGESNKNYEESAAGIDGSSNTSGSLYADKNEISNIHEVDSLKSMASGDTSASPAVQSPRIVKGYMHAIQLSKEGSNDLTHGWSSDYSAEHDLVTAYEENTRLRVRLEGVEASFLQLKTEAKSLQSLSDELGAETQSLAKQLATELASGEKLTSEVSILKSECYKFKKELEELKSATAMTQQVPDALFIDQDNFPNQHQIKWLQGLILLENKVQEIKNKACLGYCGNGLDFLSSDFDVLDCILQTLKFEASLGLGEETRSNVMQATQVLQPEHFIHGPGLEGSYMEHHPLKRSIDSTSILEEKMRELLKKLEESDSERGILTKKMDQMECYYEAFIHELEERRHQAVNELENLKTEHSSCLYTVSSLQSQVEKLQRDMGEQFVRFTSDNQDLGSLNKELEKRAVASENALKRGRLNYAIAVDRLQKDLELLSVQVLSMYETNENLAKQALTDVSQLFPLQYPENNPDEQYMMGIATFQPESTMVNGISRQICLGTPCKVDFHKENKNIFQRELPNNADVWTLDKGKIRGDGFKIKNTETSSQLKTVLEEENLVSCTERGNKLWEGSSIHELKRESASHIVESNYRLLADNIGHEETRRSLHMVQKLQVDTEAELSEMHMLNMHWEIFTEVLKEAMHNVNDGVVHMKKQMAQLAQELEHSTSEKELLMLKLHSAIEDVRKLRKEEANLCSKCDDLMLKNHVLEAKIEDIMAENDSIAKMVSEYELKYKSCLEERNEFEAMLKNENLQRSCLQSELRSTVENYKALKEEFDSQSSANSELQKTLSCLQKKLGGLCQEMVSFSEEIDSSTVGCHSLKQEMESNNYSIMVLRLEKLQQEACQKILQLHHEMKEIETDRNIIRLSLIKTESQLEHLKQKFESDLEETRMKLDFSNAVAEKLMLELEDVAAKLKFSFEAEEKLKSTNRELSSKVTIMEIEIHQANDEKRDIAQKIVEFDNVKAEFELTKQSLMDCMQDNRALKMSVESEKIVSVHLENELSNLKEGLKLAHDNLHIERGSREELKATIADLTLQLKEKDQQLFSCDEKNSELTFLRRRVNDLETEMQHFLLNSNECQKNLEDEISTLHIQIAGLEFYLAEILEHSLSADVKATYQKCQFQLMMEELIDENKAVRGKFEELHLKHADDVSSLKHDIAAETRSAVESRMKLDMSNSLVEKLKAELQDVADTSKLNLETEEKHINTNRELLSKLSILECEKQQAHNENRDMAEKILEFNNVKEELERTHFGLTNCLQENEALKMSIESGKVVSIQLENELRNLKESLKCANNNLHSERGSRGELEAAVVDLTLQLKGKEQQLLSCVEQKSELIFLRKKVFDLEIEMQNFLLHSKECQRKLDDEISTLHHQIADLEYYLAEVLDHSLIADVKLTYQKCQFQLMMEEIVNQNMAMQVEFEALELKHTDVVASLEDHIAADAQLATENERLSTVLQSMKAEKEGLLAYINEKCSVLAEFDSVKARAAMLEADNSIERHKYEDEICRLKHILVGLEEEVDNLQSAKVELENTVIILKCKLNEQNTHISLLEECEHELKILREQHSELTYKLSEQILKTEEFKNMSIHLRELKDKADAERLQAPEKRDNEGSSLALQDSLRIAFIKEQCESKLQDMKNQLFASNKYAEEMLLKVQAALAAVEIGKRTEASLAKINEELSSKMSDMEAELQTVVTNRRELANACDRMKAELECTVLSLDCCKEEKLKLEASLHECNEDRKRLRVELDLVKRLLGNLASFTADVELNKSQPDFHSTMSIGEMLKDGNSQSSVNEETLTAAAACSDEVTNAGEDPVHIVDRGNLLDTSPMLSSNEELQRVPPACGSGNSLPTSQLNLSDVKDAHVTASLIDKETSLEYSTKHISDIKEHFKEQRKLLTSMNLLHKDLERLKNDNLSSVVPLEDHHLDASLQGLQSDLSQLHEANEHLESIFPIFKELSGSGNALERVLALELELAEALQAKKKDICFQSSFLKQHNDNEAVFKSFKDINELIKDMLEVKRRNAAVETELKEMQSRYSQLSLRFAEVEGERQQLLMTLKNRSPRKL